MKTQTDELIATHLLYASVKQKQVNPQKKNIFIYFEALFDTSMEEKVRRG